MRNQRRGVRGAESQPAGFSWADGEGGPLDGEGASSEVLLVFDADVRGGRIDACCLRSRAELPLADTTTDCRQAMKAVVEIR